MQNLQTTNSISDLFCECGEIIQYDKIGDDVFKENDNVVECTRCKKKVVSDERKYVNQNSHVYSRSSNVKQMKNFAHAMYQFDMLSKSFFDCKNCKKKLYFVTMPDKTLYTYCPNCHENE